MIIFGVTIVCGLGVFYIAVWSVNGAFNAVADQNYEPLSSVLMAVAGHDIVQGNVESQARVDSHGAIEYYRQHPKELLTDKLYFQSWRSATTLADAMILQGRQTNHWESSAQLPDIGTQQKIDSWGHNFCVFSNEQEVIVVSPGSKALGSLDCGSVNIAASDLKTMRENILNTDDSGALVLIRKKSALKDSATL